MKLDDLEINQVGYSTHKWEIPLLSSYVNNSFNLKRFVTLIVTMRKGTEKTIFVQIKANNQSYNELCTVQFENENSGFSKGNKFDF